MTRNDGFTPVSANVSQGDDRLRIGTGDKCGELRDYVEGETVYWLEGVPQASYPVQNLFGVFLQSVDLQVVLSALDDILLVR